MAESPKLVTIAACSQPLEAHILRSRLEAAGIWSFIADENTVSANWLYSNAVGGVKLQVREEDAEQAIALLQEKPDVTEEIKEAEEAEETKEQGTWLTADEDVHCPECGSADTEYEKYSKRLAVLSILVLNFPLPFLTGKWRCRDCGHSWRL